MKRVILAAAVLVGILAVGLQPAGASEPLTVSQKATVAAAAKKDGLSPATIKALLADNQAMRGYPIAITTEKTPVQRVALSSVPRVGSNLPRATGVRTLAMSRASADQTCWMMTIHQNLSTVGGTAARFWTQKYWCGDGYTVTVTPPAYSWGNVYSWGSLVGYRWDGVIAQSDFNFWPQYGGFWGSHSQVQGKFEYCPYHIGCIRQYFATNTIDGYGNGAENDSIA